MSKGIKAIIYVEEQPEYVRKQLISIIYSLTSQRQMHLKKKEMLTGHVHTHNSEPRKKKKGIEKHHSPFYLPIKLSYSENDLFPVSAPSTLPHSLISSHIALSLPGAHQIHFCFETFSAYNIPPQDHHIASSSQPRRFFVGSKHIKSNISKYTHIKWNLLKTRTVELQLTSYNRHFECI